MTRDTTHTVRYSYPSLWASLPTNKAAQFLIGVVIIVIAAKLAFSGYFAFLYERNVEGAEFETNGMGSPIGLLPFAIDIVCFIGIAVMAIVGVIRQTIGPLFEGAQSWVASLQAGRSAEDSASSVGLDLPVEKLQRILQDIDARLTALEELHPEVQPEEAPTVEELQQQVAELRAKLELEG